MTNSPDKMPVNTAQAPCCGVYAIADAACIPFHIVWKECAKHYVRAKGQRLFNGGTRHPQRIAALEALGVNFEVIYAQGDTNTAHKYGHKRQNFAAWLKICDPAKTYIITVTGHVMTLRGGWLYDQSSNRRAVDYTRARKFVTSVVEISH